MTRIETATAERKITEVNRILISRLSCETLNSMHRGIRVLLTLFAVGIAGCNSKKKETEEDVKQAAVILSSPVYIVADDLYRQWLVDRLRVLGVPAATPFNTNFDELLPRAVGHTLVIAIVGDQLVLVS